MAKKIKNSGKVQKKAGRNHKAVGQNTAPETVQTPVPEPQGQAEGGQTLPGTGPADAPTSTKAPSDGSSAASMADKLAGLTTLDASPDATNAGLAAPEAAPDIALTANVATPDISVPPPAVAVMRRSNAVLGMVLCGLLGVFVGTLLPQFAHTPTPPAAVADRPLQENITHATPPPAPALGIPPVTEALPSLPETPGGAAATPAAPGANASPNLGERIALLEKRVQDAPDDAELWIKLGDSYFDDEKPAKAIAAYEKALTLRPNVPGVLTDLGIMYRETGQFDKALDAFDKAIAASPGFQNALFNSGVVLYFDLGRKAEARKRWERLLQINPQAQAPDGTPVPQLLRKLF